MLVGNRQNVSCLKFLLNVVTEMEHLDSIERLSYSTVSQRDLFKVKRITFASTRLLASVPLVPSR